MTKEEIRFDSGMPVPLSEGGSTFREIPQGGGSIARFWSQGGSSIARFPARSAGIRRRRRRFRKFLTIFRKIVA